MSDLYAKRLKEMAEDTKRLWEAGRPMREEIGRLARLRIEASKLGTKIPLSRRDILRKG